MGSTQDKGVPLDLWARPPESNRTLKSKQQEKKAFLVAFLVFASGTRKTQFPSIDDFRNICAKSTRGVLEDAASYIQMTKKQQSHWFLLCFLQNTDRYLYLFLQFSSVCPLTTLCAP